MQQLNDKPKVKFFPSFFPVILSILDCPQPSSLRGHKMAAIVLGIMLRHNILKEMKDWFYLVSLICEEHLPQK